MIRLALAKARARHEADDHRRDEFRGLDRFLCRFARKDFRVSDEIAMQRRRQLDCEPDRLYVFDRAELELRHRSRLQPV